MTEMSQHKVSGGSMFQWCRGVEQVECCVVHDIDCKLCLETCWLDQEHLLLFRAFSLILCFQCKWGPFLQKCRTHALFSTFIVDKGIPVYIRLWAQTHPPEKVPNLSKYNLGMEDQFPWKGNKQQRGRTVAEWSLTKLLICQQCISQMTAEADEIRCVARVGVQGKSSQPLDQHPPPNCQGYTCVRHVA